MNQTRLSPAEAKREYERQLAAVLPQLEAADAEVDSLTREWHATGHKMAVGSGFVITEAGTTLLTGMPTASPAELEADWKDVDERLGKLLGKRGELRGRADALRTRLRQIEHLADPSK